MANYIPVLIWTISAIICAYIAKKRKLRVTTLRSVIVALLGPLAIPLAFIINAENTVPSDN